MLVDVVEATKEPKLEREYLFFTYGSLMHGLHNHDYMADSEFVQRYTIPASAGLVMVPAEGNHFPYVLKAKAAGLKPTPIQGELYYGDGFTLREVDDLEGVPFHYRRFTLKVPVKGGRKRKAFIYLAADPNFAADAKPVPNGDWRAYLQQLDQHEEEEEDPDEFDQDDDLENDDWDGGDTMDKDDFDYSIGI